MTANFPGYPKPVLEELPCENQRKFNTWKGISENGIQNLRKLNSVEIIPGERNSELRIQNPDAIEKKKTKRKNRKWNSESRFWNSK